MHLSRTPAEAAAVAAAMCPDTAGSRPADDGEPSHPGHPDPQRPLYVPVRPCPVGFALRVFRTPLGARTAVAFTSRRRLSDCLGPGVPSVRLALPAVRALAAPLGVGQVSVDPQLTARPVLPVAEEAAPVLPDFPN
ncbi:SAV_915 family protein [Streptomyces sp. NPDC037389]|uniref:SAV_915 family protein n=1 Tax=Streptomyces sp. NPDC037389 TaxID=3155369 RepID=UPI003410E25C